MNSIYFMIDNYFQQMLKLIQVKFAIFPCVSQVWIHFFFLIQIQGIKFQLHWIARCWDIDINFNCAGNIQISIVFPGHFWICTGPFPENVGCIGSKDIQDVVFTVLWPAEMSLSMKDCNSFVFGDIDLKFFYASMSRSFQGWTHGMYTQIWI